MRADMQKLPPSAPNAEPKLLLIPRMFKNVMSTNINFSSGHFIQSMTSHCKRLGWQLRLKKSFSKE